jgi:hypothetical protein
MNTARKACVRLAPILALAVCLLGQGLDLETGFRRPPEAAKPWTYWFWMNGNLTREGITADLEAMHRVGIGGVLIMDVEVWSPKGPAGFMTTKWREMFQHMLREAGRLGIEVSMNNDAGWCGSAGPWITPELSMQMVVWSEHHVTGPRRWDAVLGRPKATQGFYRDAAVVAFPTPPAERPRMALAEPQFSYGTERHPIAGAKFIDGNAGTTVELPFPAAGSSQILDISFSKPFAAESLTVALDAYHATMTGDLAVSDDGTTFRPVRPFTFAWPVSSVNFDRIAARYFRLAFRFQSPFPSSAIAIGDIQLSPARRIEGIPAKAAFVDESSFLAGTGAPPSPQMAIDRTRIRDLTSRMDHDGRIRWDVPHGEWTVLRFGHTSTGKVNYTAPVEGLGLECDRLSRQAVDTHFAGFIARLVEQQRAVGGNALRHAHIDSWESGSQNWTPQMPEEFRKLRGYGPLAYLPVLTGRAVGSDDISERFLWDLRRTVADLLLHNYAERFRELSLEHGLKLSIEGYGNGPLDDLPYAGLADIPMGEFWTGEGPWWVTKQMASAAHTYGRPVLAEEAFTAHSFASKWTNAPSALKALGDRMFTQGVNRMVFHRYAMQPWLDLKPGMTMGPYGIHFERTNTWWEQSRAWLTYLARCQFLLQQGTFVADIGYLDLKRLPNDHIDPASSNLAPPAGYDFDAISNQLLMRDASVSGGRVTLPSGMSYRVLVLPLSTTMSVAHLRKIRQLVEDGAVVVGPPPARSPGLSGYPGNDAEVRRLASELWGPIDGASLTERRVGKGKLVWGQPLKTVMAEAGVPPDFACDGAETGGRIRYLHRVAGGKDIYFVASGANQAAAFLCSFRVTGKRPQLWHPDTGAIESVAVYEQTASETRIPIRLDPSGSVFVVFDGQLPASPARLASVTRDGVEVSGLRAFPASDRDFPRVQVNGTGYSLETAAAGRYLLRSATGKAVALDLAPMPAPREIPGPWQVNFPDGWGAPPQVTLDRLISWPSHDDEGVRHFSGTASYRRQIDIPGAMLRPGLRLYLDLGRVEVIAEVSLNGHDLGICWKPPFRVNITEAAREGANDLQIKVTNLWPNRMIGDLSLPPDVERNGTRLKSWPQWLLEGRKSPSGRLTFTTWQPWSKGDPLLESGLLGPVALHVTTRVDTIISEPRP